MLCHTRGKKSDAVVGDRVRWQARATKASSSEILPRTNLLVPAGRVEDEGVRRQHRPAARRRRRRAGVQRVAARARADRRRRAPAIPARIVLNKRDLPAFAAARERLRPYDAIGVDVLELALKHDSAMTHAPASRRCSPAAPRSCLGPSGAGKSTLVNLMVADAKAQIGEISQALNTGRHTTTATQWYWLDPARDERAHRLARLPGIRPAAHIDADRLAAPDARHRRHASECRFYNCTHRHEPGCGVLAALGARRDRRVALSRSTARS